jgi:hypothetical protein
LVSLWRTRPRKWTNSADATKTYSTRNFGASSEEITAELYAAVAVRYFAGSRAASCA